MTRNRADLKVTFSSSSTPGDWLDYQTYAVNLNERNLLIGQSLLWTVSLSQFSFCNHEKIGNTGNTMKKLIGVGLIWIPNPISVPVWYIFWKGVSLSVCSKSVWLYPYRYKHIHIHIHWTNQTNKKQHLRWKIWNSFFTFK